LAEPTPSTAQRQPLRRSFLEQATGLLKALALVLVAGVAAYWTWWARAQFKEQEREIALREERIAALNVAVAWFDVG
jgi:Tfp pilus assembly protein PilN